MEYLYGYHGKGYEKSWNLSDVRSQIPCVRLTFNFAHGTNSKTINDEFSFISLRSFSFSFYSIFIH